MVSSFGLFSSFWLISNDILGFSVADKIFKYVYSGCMLSWVGVFPTPWTIVCQAPLSLGFSRQEYWSELPFPPPGDLPYPGIKPMSPESPALADGVFTTKPPGKSRSNMINCVVNKFALEIMIDIFSSRKFIRVNLFLAVLDLHCCMSAFSSCGDQGPVFIV